MAGVTSDGIYTVDLDRDGPLPAQRIYCDMARDGGGWTLMFNHQTSGGYFSGAVDAASSNQDDPMAEKYSILDRLQNLQRDGSFTFRINWPGYTKHNIWSQTTSPTADVNVAGYNPIDVQLTSNNWGGLELNQGTHGPGDGSTYLDGSINHENWFYAIGVNLPWCGGIPASYDLLDFCTPVQWVQLWVR
jgi:Fibrinogen beta and gamma chains, C-terminal globular domain